MRVTNSMINDRVLRDLQRQMGLMAKAADQVSTGQRLGAVSEDPVAGATVLRADRELRGNAQYRRSISSVRGRLDAEEATLDQVGDLLARAKELALGQGGDNANGSTRAGAAVEVQALFDQLISLGNTRVGNEHVFGGLATGAPPFQADGTYVGTATSRQAEIGAGTTIGTVHSGQQLLVDSGVLAAVRDLRDALTGNDAPAIRDAAGALTAAFDTTQSNLAEVGARGRALEVAVTNIEGLDQAATDARISNGSISIEEAAMRLASAQSALQAAFAATSRIMTTSLTEYLR